MYNKVILIGNLGADPDVRTLDSGTKVAKFSLATNENYQDSAGEWQKKTEWHNVIAWRYMAEKAERDLKKGTMVFIEGKVTYRKWQDQEGKDRYSTDIVASSLKLLEKRESGGSGYTNSFPTAEDAAPYVNSGTAPTSSAPQATTTPTPAANPLPAAEDDLPF